MAGAEPQCPDDEQVIRVAGSSGDAFDELARKWRPRLLAFARSVLRDGALAEDAVQDCLLNAYRALDSYEERGRFRAFLFKILRNCCLRLRGKEARARRRGAAPRGAFPSRDVEGRLHPAGSRPAAVEGGTAEPRSVGASALYGPEELRNAFEGLPEDLREAVRLRVIEEMDYAQAARLLGEKPDTVRKRVYKALEILRRKFGR